MLGADAAHRAHDGAACANVANVRSRQIPLAATLLLMQSENLDVVETRKTRD